MNELFNLLKGAAPVLANVIAGPLGGMAVAAIANKLGVPPEQISSTIQNDPEAFAKIKELELEYAKLAFQDRASARERESTIASSTAPFVSKIITPILALAIVSVWGLIQWFLLNNTVPQEMRELVIRVLGTMDGALMLVLSYYFGSSNEK
jgi:nitrate reductase NapE component